jgi:hypothetical protein
MSFSPLLLLLFVTACQGVPLAPHNARARATALKSVPREVRLRHAARMRKWAAPQHLRSSPWAPIFPTSYGADPTGVADSTAAFGAAVEALLARNTSGHADEGGSVDLGGAIIDLQGGDYLISSPLVFPSNYSNYGLIHGTLRASAAFPPSANLLEVGTAGGYCSNWGDSCTEDVTLEDLLLDGAGVAGGGVRFNAVIGANAAHLFVVNFTAKGVVMEGGHEVLLSNSWVGACWYTPPASCWLNASALKNTTGIWINGNDHYLDQVIVFAGTQGVVVDGAANILSGVHTWNTQSGSVPWAIGIAVNVWQNRLVGPYLDFVPLVLQGAALTTVTGAFFLGGAQIIFKPHPDGYPVRGVYIAGSQFASSGDVPDVVSTRDPPGFSGLEDVTITGSLSDDPAMPRRSTVCTKTLVAAAPPWNFDFTDCLAFNASAPGTPIQSVSVAVSQSRVGGVGFVAMADPCQGALVTVRPYLGAPAEATVTVTVDQSVRRGP